MKKLAVAMTVGLFSQFGYTMTESQINEYVRIIDPALECQYLYQLVDNQEKQVQMTILVSKRLDNIMPYFVQKFEEEIATLEETTNIPQTTKENRKYLMDAMFNTNYIKGYIVGESTQQAKSRIREEVFGKMTDYKTMAEIKIREKNCDFIR